MKKKKPSEVKYNIPINLDTACVRIVKGLKEKEECWGQFTEDSEGRPTIELDSNLRGSALKSTLLHEAFHMTFHISGVSHILEDRQEEALVRSLENIFIPLLPSLLSLLDKLETRDET